MRGRNRREPAQPQRVHLKTNERYPSLTLMRIDLEAGRQERLHIGNRHRPMRKRDIAPDLCHHGPLDGMRTDRAAGLLTHWFAVTCHRSDGIGISKIRSDQRKEEGPAGLVPCRTTR